MKVESVIEIKSFTRICGLAFLFLYFFSNYIMTLYRIEGNSMNPVLVNGERVISCNLYYKLTSIQRGDVVAFTCPSDPRKTYIKRIIGLPGEVIQIRNGKIFVDNKPIDDSFIPTEFRTKESLNPIRIPLGHYFVAGDHRNISSDSRVWATLYATSPFVPRRYIMGKIFFRIWPLSEIGSVKSLFSTQMIL
ncbi:signal peptidase I [bacterium]|nr:signal peptidase I [bacterium]